MGINSPDVNVLSGRMRRLVAAAVSTALGITLVLACAQVAAAITEIWIDEFDNTTLISSAQNVTVSAGRVQLNPNPLERQGLQFGDGNVGAPSILRVGTSYYMYYSSGISILLATSSDANNWTRQGVVVAPGLAGSSDASGVTDEDVLLAGSTFHMWYSGLGSSGDYAIHHAASSDGKSWSPDGVVISASSEGISGSVYAPSVLWDGVQFRMWFTHYDGVHTWIRLATSADGLSWLSRGVVLSPVADGIDDGGPRMPDVLRVGTEFLMWYTCVGRSAGQICRARSADGASYMREGVVLGPDPNLPGENVLLALPAALPLSPNSYRIWYGARGTIGQIYSALSVGGYRMSGTLVSAPIDLPSNLTWLSATVSRTTPPGTSITLTVRDASTGLAIAEFTNVTAPVISLVGINPRSVPMIRLQAWFGSTGASSPSLENWTVTFGTPISTPVSFWNLYLPLIIVGVVIAAAGVGAGIFIMLLARPPRMPPAQPPPWPGPPQ